jgi:sortase A
MIFAHRLPTRSLALPLILIAMLALAGCGSSSAEAATASEAAPAVQATQQPQAQPTVAEAAAAGVAARPTDAPSVQKAAAIAASAASEVETGIPTRLVLPSIKLDTGVTELGWSTAKSKEGQVFSQWDVAEYAAGWHKNSAEPGQGENVVLSGHNNILGAVFRELDQLKRGDKAVLYVGDKPFEYLIDKVMIVPERTATAEQRLENGEWIQPAGEERLTLVSCWPRDDNSHRIIVIAHPVTTN